MTNRRILSAGALLLLLLLLTLPLQSAHAQGIPIKSGATSDLLTINTNKAALVVAGIPTRKTYVAASNGLTTTALFNISIEASAGTGFKLAGWCVGFSNATAAAAVTVSVNRRSTGASTGGTVMTAEGTGTDAISKMDPTDADFGGIARRTAGALGTIGALIDSQGIMIGELGAGLADPPGPAPFCKYYGQDGASKMPTVDAGVTNGISINVSTHGAGALASGSISAIIIEE